MITETGAIDVNLASDSLIPADPHDALQVWDVVLSWASGGTSGEPERAVGQLCAPSPRPRQIFGIGLNYAPHAAESGFQVPAFPFVFSKLSGSTAGPVGDLTIDSATVDWEAEVVVVIGRHARRVDAAQAWQHVAGVTAGQDFSDRAIQWRLGPNSQPTLGKSLPGFGPTGPYLVTPDEYDDVNDIGVSGRLNGEWVQQGRTSDLVFSVPQLIEYLSAVTDLFPGDLIFTGTPEGVGHGQVPPVYLRDGDTVTTTVDRAGTMVHQVRLG